MTFWELIAGAAQRDPNRRLLADEHGRSLTAREFAGERVCAVVVPTSADSVSLESLVQHCHSHGLSRYKHPERLVVVDALPRNQFGKVIKKELRETFG